MNDYHGYGGFNGGWVNMDEFFCTSGISSGVVCKVQVCSTLTEEDKG